MASKKKFAPFQTHVGLLLYLQEDGDEFVVTLVGDNIKELLRTPDKAAAMKYAESIKLHYEERRLAEAQPN